MASEIQASEFSFLAKQAILHLSLTPSEAWSVLRRGSSIFQITI
jgi:hypothetical protein